MNFDNFYVDGHETDDPESNLAPDYDHAPFMVFDIAQQDYVGGMFATRADAQKHADMLNRKDL
jgi:hypothetical protein